MVAHLFTWDARSQLYRAPGQAYREVCELMRGQMVAYKDEAASFQKLELKFARDITPYPHQTEALAAWIRAQRQGVVVLPTGSGKTLVAQLAMQSTPRSTLICVPIIDLMHQWYSSLMAAFPDANIGLLGGGSHDETPILISTYDSAARYAEQLAGKYALLICDEVHHLPSDFSRVIAEMSLAPYRLGLTATPKRSDGRERDLDTLLGPVVYEKQPGDLKGQALADYKEVQILVRLSETEQRHYDELIATRNAFLFRSNIKLGSLDGWKEFVMSSGSPAGRAAMLAHREARSLAYGTEGKLRVLEEILVNHFGEQVLIFTDDNLTVYKISREFLIPAITHQTPVKERYALMQAFKEGRYKQVVASRILNEGTDVPEASVGVVMSGSATEREQVQRLGRILRKSPGKKAVMYEIVTEGTSEERVSKQRKGQWKPNTQSGPVWENVNAPD